VPSASLQALLARAATALEQSEIMPLGDTRPERWTCVCSPPPTPITSSGWRRANSDAPTRHRAGVAAISRRASEPGGRVEQMEPDFIQAALDTSRGNISESARTLGLTRRGLYLKLRRLGLESRSESEVDAI
jgi:DNA-binding NtrC family response regulator